MIRSLTIKIPGGYPPAIKPYSMHRLRTGLLIFMVLVSVHASFCQCTYFPADCPSDRQLPDSSERYGNPLLPQEVSMEIKLHNFFSDQMQLIADKKKWELYVFDESSGSGFLNAERTGPLAFNQRPPHEYGISFILIVDQDSLRAWRDWLKDYTTKMQDQIKDLAANGNMTGFTKMQEFLKSKTESFRNASMIRVKFEINPGSTAVSTITENLHLKTMAPVPHAVVAIQAHNDKTDVHGIYELNQFTRCNDFVFLLFGNWITKPVSDLNYFPLFHPGDKKMDVSSIKAIPCDRVRAIALHVEGAPKYISQFMQLLDTESIYQNIHKE